MVTLAGALVGAAIDELSGGDDSNLDGAIKGAVIANVARIVLPVAITYAVGWFVLRGLEQVRGTLARGDLD